MNIIQRKRISGELKKVARELSHKYITEGNNIEKLENLAEELVEDHPKEDEKMLIED